MTMRKLPVVPTIIVLLAVGVMLRLGLWQLDRRVEKAALLERYAAAAKSDARVPWPADAQSAQDRLYRRSQLTCAEVTATSSIAGQDAQGQSGLAIVAECRLGNGEAARVVLGWSKAPVTPEWPGGDVRGVIAPGPRLVADPPRAGLKANAIPDPSSIPDNHLAYAVQWFLFALTALVIYGLAVRKRLAR